ncbi:UxaA family hydrolase [Halalkalibacterium ligniniphilum]|uniref:UxaA family hydrolase n=1 Tax=Halalkalibacterium ligniniphilum TaxID=1134413 RepID=UPI0003472434|nr:UxaA family hydrolase [Halalkalibacterium ligniniphilum]
MTSAHKAVMMKPQDKVAVALTALEAGTEIFVTCEGKTINVTLKDPIEFGHKFAVTSMIAGEDIIKYGEVIGAASQAISAGQHVHVHNLEGKRGRGDKV